MSDSDEDPPAATTDGGAYDGSDDAFRRVWTNRVRMAETDRQAIVYYGEYVTYQDEAVSAYRRELGFDAEYVRGTDWSTRMVATEMEYHESARYEDVLVNEVRVARIGETSVTYEYRVRREDDDRLLAKGSVTQVIVDEETAEPTPVPDAFRDAVADRQSP
ncbi:acyl-CoA thioesterase [Halovivax cerinus]|uniref:Acyl-CoA thioesterase n=1 Tax=Halovivax cerinus TaxID=1487865 RepID=A0ABD5NNU8_9EURY|nr:thioesterase family protein [Halovivax cerinus]